MEYLTSISAWWSSLDNEDDLTVKFPHLISTWSQKEGIKIEDFLSTIVLPMDVLLAVTVPHHTYSLSFEELILMH